MQILLIIIAAIFQIHFTQINDNNRPLIVVLIKKKKFEINIFIRRTNSL